MLCQQQVVLHQQQTPPLHTLPISSFFYLIADEGPRVTSKSMLFSANKATNQGLFYPFTVPISNNSLFEKLKKFLSTETLAILGE